MTGEREVHACPECDGTRVRRRLPGHPHSSVAEQRPWYCSDCEARFDEPKRRPARSDTGYPEDSAQAALLAADPNEVFSD